MWISLLKSLRLAKYLTSVATPLIGKFDTKEAVPPVLILYTDSGPENSPGF